MIRFSVIRKIVLILMVVSIAVACSVTRGYDSRDTSRGEPSLIRAHGVTFHTVNKITVSPMSNGVLVLPGDNHLTLTINSSNFNDPGNEPKILDLFVKSAAGREYAVTGQRGNGRVCAYLVDTTTGVVDFATSIGCVSRTR